jgi:hypothetical protein
VRSVLRVGGDLLLEHALLLRVIDTLSATLADDFERRPHRLRH